MKNIREINAIVSAVKDRIEGLLKNLALEGVVTPTYSTHPLEVSGARGFSLCSPAVGINDILTFQVTPKNDDTAEFVLRFCGLDRDIARASIAVNRRAMNEPTELVVDVSDRAVKFLLAPRPKAPKVAYSTPELEVA